LVLLELSVDGHIATGSKDRTSLFDGQFLVPGVESGETVKRWLAGGAGGQRERHWPQDTSTLITEIFSALRELRLADMVRQYERYLISKYGCGIKGLDHGQLSQQLENLHKCKQDNELCEKFRSYLSQLGEAQGA
ncbi:MAG: hypothetical protein R6V55_15450, partial [Desulfovermiculus sp.]